MKQYQNRFTNINNLDIIYISIILLFGLYFCTNQYIISIYKDNNLINIKKLESDLFNKTLELDNIKKNMTKQNTNMDIFVNQEFVNKEFVNSNSEKIYNPLVPPLKTNYHFTNPSINKMPINIETRESGGDYQQIGMVHKTDFINKDLSVANPGFNDESVLLALFGKPVYKASRNWNYYVLSHKDNIKIPVINNNNNCTDNTNGCSELNNNDIIDIEQYNGKFKIQLYKFDAPKYIPYI